MDKKLFFREDGTFKLMQLTDIHYCQEDIPGDAKTLALIEELIQAERPDFVMITGDAVYGERNLEYLGRVMESVIRAGIPFSFTFGNHDAEYADNKAEIMETLRSMPGCRLWHDPASMDGAGNHFLELCGRDGRPQWLLFGIDSGQTNPMEHVGGYAYVTSRQIDWYRRTIASYEEKGDPFSAMVFMHTALHEHAEVWKYEICYGTKRDGCGHSRINSGFFSVMLEAGHTKGVFVGHDHTNDYWGRLYGIALGYGRCTGFGTYGAQDFPRGCRIFRFTEGDTDHFETYERLEYGIVVDDPWIQHPIEKRDEG